MTLLKIFPLGFFWLLILCQHAGSEVRSPPTSQSVALNTNASFTCITSVGAKWVIKWNYSETTATIIPLNGVPGELREKGFIVINSKRESSKDPFNNTLIVLGSSENNNTEINCQMKAGQSDNTGPPAMLTVIGPPDAPVNVIGSVMQFSPVVIVRLEWQAPFSHDGHDILYYTVYTHHFNETNVTDLYHNVHIHNEFGSCKAYIAVSATNDIGESKPSVVTSISKVLAMTDVTVDGKIISQSHVSIIELQIQFPELCLGQNIYYTVEVTEMSSGDIVYQHSTAIYYTGELVFDRVTISRLTSIKYSVIVHLETNRGRFSSSITNNSTDQEESGTDQGSEKSFIEGTDQEENGSDQGVLVIITAVLSTVLVLALVIVGVVVAVVIVRTKLPSRRYDESKQASNPIYEGPLYENLEEQQNNISPPSAAGDRLTTSISNIYESSPIPIPNSQEEERMAEGVLGFYAVITAKSNDSQAVEEEIQGRERAGEEEGGYAVMRSPTGISFTPSREDRSDWLGNRS